MGRRQANLCFHFAGSGENLPDITKSRDTSMDNKKQNSFLFTSYSGRLGHGSDEKNAIFSMAKLRRRELAFVMFR